MFSARARLASIPACAARRALHRSNARYANSSWHLHAPIQPLEAVYRDKVCHGTHAARRIAMLAWSRCESSPPFPAHTPLPHLLSVPRFVYPCREASCPQFSTLTSPAQPFEQIQWIHNCTASFLAIPRRISLRRHDLRPSRPCIDILLEVVEQPADS